VVFHCGGGSFKSQMKRADACGAQLAVIIGDDEAREGSASLKPLREEQPQKRMPLDSWPRKSAIIFLGMTTMATYDLEEQEQISELKTWWRMYGNLVTGVLLAVAIGVAGWQGWNYYQRKQAAEASAVYAAVQKAAAERDPKRAREAAGELIDKYPGTAYAAMAALTSARLQFDAGDLKTAKAQLQWVVDKAATRTCAIWAACVWPTFCSTRRRSTKRSSCCPKSRRRRLPRASTNSGATCLPHRARRRRPAPPTRRPWPGRRQTSPPPSRRDGTPSTATCCR
jgi:hypothetical protein